MLWPQPCSLVATIHDLAAFHVKRKYDWKRMFYGRVVARYLAQRQTKIITVSQSTAHDLQRFFAVPRECISVIYNGIDHDRFRPPVDRQTAQDAVARRYGLNQPFFLYVARLEHPGKNHLRLIEAFNRFKHETGSSWKLAFGGSDWHGAHAIHAAITQSVYANDIHCLGFVADAELPQLYWAAETFVYPSLFEGFGLPPLEAMACGCPVVCSTRGSLGEVVGDAAITIDPEKVDEITLALARTATEHELRARLQSLGIETAKRFTWESCARGTLDTYATAYSSSFTSARAARLRVANSAPPMGAGDSSLASERARR
jgi:glycosyltransferase involved in cell wall biosynthesis